MIVFIEFVVETELAFWGTTSEEGKSVKFLKNPKES